MREDRTVERIKVIKFNDNGEYYFTVKDIIVGDKDKKVYVGTFSSRPSDSYNANESAPGKCRLDVEYCLKRALIEFPLKMYDRPQHRHFWDFVEFAGDNIREILAMSNGAKRMNKDVTEGTLDLLNNISDKGVCQYECAVIEPYYHSFDVSYFPSVTDKIDCMLQIIAGLKQLMESEVIRNAKITAHRDLKFRNIMLQKNADGKYTVRLIDFPSIKTEEEDKGFDPSRTTDGAFSVNNTTPEEYIEKYKVSGKNDVFVLGCMLAEIFGIWDCDGDRNPLSVMYDKAGLDIRKTEACTEFYNEVEKVYSQKELKDFQWLENFLESKYGVLAHWKKAGNVHKEIKNLFDRATRINPDDRISLEDFESILKNIKSCVDSSSKAETRKHIKKIFLVDLKNLDAHRDAYIAEMQKVMNEGWTRFEPVLVTYDWCDGDKNLQPSAGFLDVVSEDPILFGVDLENFVRRFSASAVIGNRKSSLKGCLYEVIQQMNEFRGEYSSEIHIFTPEAPAEGNMCQFQDTVPTRFGNFEIVTRSARDIVADLVGARVVVHTFEGVSEGWYEIKHISTEVNNPQGSSPENKITDPPASKADDNEIKINIPESSFVFTD